MPQFPAIRSTTYCGETPHHANKWNTTNPALIIGSGRTTGEHAMMRCSRFYEPRFKGLHTVMFSLVNPDFVMHRPSKRCELEYPHEMKECGEFDQKLTRREQ